MEIVKLVHEVNEHLSNKGSISSFEREYGYGKDTVRKKLNKHGYVYKKAIKQFVVQDVTQIDSDVACSLKEEKSKHKKISIEEFKDLSTEEKINVINQFSDGIKTLRNIEVEHFQFKNIGLYIDKNEAYWSKTLKKFILKEQTVKGNFNDEEIKILKEIVSNYKIKQELNRNNDEIVLRSIRTYKSSLDNLSQYCKKNKVKQQEIIALAIEQYITNN